MSVPTATDWSEVCARDFAVPAGRPLDALVDELAAALADPDPLVRDGDPYAVLGTWIERDVVAGELRTALGHRMAARFGDPAIEARSFAALVLDMIVSRGDHDPAWFGAFARWYPAETDLRGHHPELGWLHAAAHGADLLGTFGRHPAVAPGPVLDLAAARLLARTDHLFGQREDERTATGVARTLTRPELTEKECVDWVERSAAALADHRRGPAPAWVSNCARTLRALLVLARTGVRAAGPGTPLLPLAHGPAVTDALLRALGPV
ncbi:DUF2785 domain-containing protein [Kitasatospora sp. NPDC058201]|uniref:DUF2785 domain-containing protein n=1 Tax=unclassified Kitasatospora TaxID=2633591 RepID=UPI003660CB3C